MTDVATTRHGDRVAYDRYGNGPALVFVAGAGPFRATDPVTTRTARLAADAGLTTLVLDRLGRGESPADGPLTLKRELAAVAAVIDAAGGRAALCGHSSGCTISLAAAHAGLPVTGLVLWEAPLGDPAATVRDWVARFEDRLDAEDYVGATETYMEDMPPEWLEGMRSSPEFEQWARASRSQRADARSLLWATEAIEDGSLAQVTVPVLATYGTSTFPMMPAAAEVLASTLPRGTTEAVPGAQHSWEPEPMAARLAAFVHDLPG